ncbi:MAG: PEP-CTERM sorting domain-containing protein [Candidatus Thiodiazotropha taylori]|nr:PEP-CTERM sorting domain-containing protein [Candidatus Thiodiazotropha taylori]
MKRLIATTLAFATFCVSTAIQAYPIYTGDATADFGNRPGSASSNAAGYYIWTNDTYQEWSVRWTGNDYGTVLSGDWSGRVSLSHLIEDSVVEFSFGRRDELFVIQDGWGDIQDYIYFTGRSGSGYDGFDFSVDTNYFNVVNFSLSSTLFDIEPTNGGGVTEGTGIYIGENMETPLVDIRDQHGQLAQKFAITNVPEPSTLALLGLGLAGIGARKLSRKRK